MIKTIKHIFQLFSLVALTLISLRSFALEKPSAPVQPAFGYGGKSYTHKSMTIEVIGIQENQYHLFIPDEPKPKKAGIVIFLHDETKISPKYYMAWIRHLCRKGWIVIYPNFQGQGEPSKNFLFNAVRDIKDALKLLFKRGLIEFNNTKTAIIGHGIGATLGANIAATSNYFGIPTPKDLMFAMPSKQFLHLKDLSGISKYSKMLVIVGDRVDNEIKDTAREIFYAADRVKTNNKNYLTFLSDFRGEPPLLADREAPLAPEEPVYDHEVYKRRYEFVKFANDKVTARDLRTKPVDGMDWYGTFRLFDAMAANVFYNKPSEDAFGNTPQQRFMGYWSNGKKVRGILSSVRP